MEKKDPRIIENREFVELEEEDIQRLNRQEAVKFEENPRMDEIMSTVESDLGPRGEWEEHWMTVDPSGRRVYARVYYAEDRALAVTAAGEIVREVEFPEESDDKNAT